MAYNGFAVAATVKELNDRLLMGSISKVAQPEKDELLLSIKNNRQIQRLLISADPSLPLMRLLEDNELSQAAAPSFCMSLRKHIGGGRIMRIYQPGRDLENEGLERIVVFEIEHLDELGIQGVFASTSMASGTDWRWQTHLFNMPLWKEFGDILTTTEASSFDFTYNENYKALWDLYLDNSTTAKGMVSAKTDADSMAEFALGQCAMVQNGNWGAAQILGQAGNVVASEDIKFLPLYMGFEGEESQGLCVGTENYLSINIHASDEAKANADTFLTWLFSSDTGKKIVKENLMFITPFNSFTEEELPEDPLAKEVNRWMNMDGVTSVPWAFQGIPSEQWKSDFGGALLQYISESMDWSDVVEIARNSWTVEAEIAGR